MDSSKEMLGTFSPQQEAYTHEMPEETTPSGLFARGSYSARSKVTENNISIFFLVIYDNELMIQQCVIIFCFCSFLMMTTSATWRSTILLILGRNGLEHGANLPNLLLQ